MDRSMIAPWKAEERDLSEKLHKKLLGLTLLYPPTEEFRKSLSNEMFLKPNQTAFFQVMHYLFRLLDAVEFKRRFYWPITDKRSESHFRTATVEYIKHLNEKHQIKINITSYLMVMPGGMKFINFLLEFVSFVVRELIKQREKQINFEVDSNQMGSVDLQRMRRRNEFFKKYASEYIMEIDSEIKKLNEKSKLIWQQLDKISMASNIEISQLVDDSFLTGFAALNKKLFQEKFIDPKTKIDSLEKRVAALKGATDEFQAKQANVRLNKMKLSQSLRKINERFPFKTINRADIELLTDSPNHENVGMDILIAAFNSIYTALEDLLNTNEMPESPEIATIELSELARDFQEIESQLVDFQKELNNNINKRMNERRDQNIPQTPQPDSQIEMGLCKNILLSKLVATPCIRLEDFEPSRNANVRLPLIEDCNANAVDAIRNISIMPSPARKPKPFNKSCDFNKTMNKSKKLDPRQLLRSICKIPSKTTRINQTQVHNLSELGTKWNEHQNGLGNDLFATPRRQAPSEMKKFSFCEYSELADTAKSTILIQTPKTPFNTNDLTRIPVIPQNVDASGGNSSVLHGKKLSAVKKVQDASLNFHNLNTSPSGRLQSLVLVDPGDLYREQMNEMTMSEDKITKLDISRSEQPELCSTNKENNLPNPLEDEENNKNMANVAEKASCSIIALSDDDEIFNISDSVLDDVIM